MILREIVLTCSNPHVARAAVASIGGDFASRFSRGAAERNIPSGLLAARLVRHFVRNADEGDWLGLNEAARGAEMPILAGLRYILDPASNAPPTKRAGAIGQPPQSRALLQIRGRTEPEPRSRPVSSSAGPPGAGERA